MGTAAAFKPEADDGALDFETLVKRHQAMVFSIAFHFLQDRSAAEELAQGVFLQLHRHLGALQSADHVTFWLRRVTTHRCIDYSRRRRWNFVRLASVAEPAAPTASPDLMLSRRVQSLVAGLPAPARLARGLAVQEHPT